MARKKFNVHDLYPADYCFDYAAFWADPEAYVFTPEDIAYWNAMDLERFEAEWPMTPYEKRAVRKWVREGNSPYDNGGSKYYCFAEYGASTFLDIYRTDREIDQEIKGMKKAEQIAYLKDLLGYRDQDETNTPTGPFIDENGEEFPF